MATAKKAVPTGSVKRAGVVKPTPKVVPSDNYSVKEDDDYGTGSVIVMQSGKILGRARLQHNDVDCSCGIKEADGVRSFHELFLKLKAHPKRDQIVKDAITAAVDSIKADEGSAWVMLSNHNKNVEVNAMLDELCHTCTDWKKNPSSGSTIRAWIMG